MSALPGNPVATVLELVMAQRLDHAAAMTEILAELDAVDARVALMTAAGIIAELVREMHSAGVTCGPCWYQQLGTHAATNDVALRAAALDYRSEVGG